MIFPTLLFALFITVSKFKGDPRLASLIPFDLTVALALSVYVIILFRLREHNWSVLPREMFLYIPFVFVMLVSVIYTPLPYAGIEKTARFVLLTGLAIIAPIFILSTPGSMSRFLRAIATIYFMLALESLSALGSTETLNDERLIAAGGLTIELGVAAATAIIIIIFLILPNLQGRGTSPHYYWKKAGLYCALTILILALLGSGARSATLAASVCLLLNILFWFRRAISDYFVLAVAVIISFFFVKLPENSFDYLATLIHSDTSSLLNWRGHLMHRGIDLTVEYPLTGVGIGGFPYYGNGFTPAPWFLYNWPHNVVLEISSEMGLVNALIACLLIFAAFKETARQLLDKAFEHKNLSRTVLGLLILGFITFMNTGDINDNRSMWLYMTLPFVIRVFSKSNDRNPNVEGKRFL